MCIYNKEEKQNQKNKNELFTYSKTAAKFCLLQVALPMIGNLAGVYFQFYNYFSLFFDPPLLRNWIPIMQKQDFKFCPVPVPGMINYQCFVCEVNRKWPLCLHRYPSLRHAVERVTLHHLIV